jgi:ABC-type transporter Mla subunit MlaD
MWALVAIGIGLLVLVAFIWWARRRSGEAEYFERDYQDPPVFDTGGGF